MPIHDWTRVPAGLFHHFHQDWSIEIARTLNRGRLPKGLSALVEKSSLESGGLPYLESGGLPHYGKSTTIKTRRFINKIFAGLANRIVVKRHLERIVAVIEIVSPGNKDSKAAIRQFLDKTLEFIRGGIHVLVVDLLPPTGRDPHGIHKLFLDEMKEEGFSFPPGKDRILASYRTHERLAYVEPIGVGDILPDMPLFLGSELKIKVPLESTYQATWEAMPKGVRTASINALSKLPRGVRKVVFPVPSRLINRVEEKKKAEANRRAEATAMARIKAKREATEAETLRLRMEAYELMQSNPAMRQLLVDSCGTDGNCPSDESSQSAPPPPSHARPSGGSRGRRSGR